MGKISRNEILQLNLEQLKAQKAVGIARRDMEIATLNLRSYTGLSNTDKIALSLPEAIINMNVDTAKVVAEAYENRSDAIGFVRRIMEAKRDVAKAKGDNGLNATLTARLGFSKSAPHLEKFMNRLLINKYFNWSLIFRFWIGEGRNQEQKQQKPITVYRVCSRAG